MVAPPPLGAGAVDRAARRTACGVGVLRNGVASRMRRGVQNRLMRFACAAELAFEADLTVAGPAATASLAQPSAQAAVAATSIERPARLTPKKAIPIPIHIGRAAGF